MRDKTYGETAMNWVKLKAYGNGAFALKAILDRFEADVEEANRLPEQIRAQRTFSMDRDGARDAKIKRDSGADGIRTMLTLYAIEDAVFCESQGTLRVPIRAVPQDTGEVKWSLDDAAPIPLWELSRMLLGRYVFEF